MRSIPSSSIRASDASSAGRFAWMSVMTAAASDIGCNLLGSGDRVAAHKLVGERAERGAEDRPDDVDPEVGPLASRERRAERTSGVQGGAGDGTAEKGVEPNGPADRDGCGCADRPGVGGDG